MTKKTKKVDSAPKGGRGSTVASPRRDAGLPVDAGPIPGASTLAADLVRPGSKRRWSRDRVFLTLGSELGAVSTPVEAARVLMSAADRLFGLDAFTLAIYSEEKDRMYPVLSVDRIEGECREVPPPHDGATVSGLSRRVLTDGALLILRSPEEVALLGPAPVSPSPASTSTAPPSDVVAFKAIKRTAASSPGDPVYSFGDKQRRSASLMFVPIRRAGKTFGVVSAQSYTFRAYTKKDLKTLQALADHGGGALERTFSEERLRRKEQQTLHFLELGKRLGDASTPEEAAHVILTTADDLIGWDAGFINVLSKDKTRVRSVVTYDRVEGERRRVPSAYEGADPSPIIRRVLREGPLILLRDGGESPVGAGLVRFGDRAKPSASLLFTPIRRGGENIGVLSIQSYRRDAYTPDDLELLQALADHCGGALDRTFAEAALVEAHSDLARRVEERTRELSEANAQLQREMGERIRAEEQARLQHERLVQTERLVALGTLVSGVAHEINNPNNFITLNTSVIEEVWRSLRPVLDDYHEEHGDFPVGGLMYSEMRDQMDVLLAGILDGARRIGAIVRELRDFTRRRPAEYAQPVDLNRVVRSALLLLDNLVRSKTHRFTVALGKDLPLLRGHPQRLEQVVANLVQNAWQALPNPECGIVVSTAHDPEHQTVVLRVEDEGVGIPHEALKHVTDPFYTTKRDEGGMGLGLSISSSIVDEHGGALSLESTPGAGTVVTVVLPVSPPDFSPLADSP